MKKLFAAVTLLVMAFGAEARITAHSSWSEIYRAGLWPDFHKIQFHNTFVPVINTCVDAEADVVKAEVDICKKWEYRGGEGDAICVKEERVVVAKPLTQTYERCVEYGYDNDCRRSVTDTYRIATYYKVDIYENWGTELGERRLFTKVFTIPSCQ